MKFLPSLEKAKCIPKLTPVVLPYPLIKRPFSSHVCFQSLITKREVTGAGLQLGPRLKQVHKQDTQAGYVNKKQMKLIRDKLMDHKVGTTEEAKKHIGTHKGSNTFKINTKNNQNSVNLNKTAAVT